MKRLRKSSVNVFRDAVKWSLEFPGSDGGSSGDIEGAVSRVLEAGCVTGVGETGISSVRA